MSFLSKVQPLFRQAAITRPSPRLFSTAVVYHKSATDVVKDGLKAVDRTVSDNIVAGIDKGVELKDKAATTTATQVEKPTAETVGQVKGKASELAGEAKGKAAELKGEAKAKLS